MRTVKLGLIGAGICVRDLYWPELQQIPDKFEIIAVAGSGSERGRKFAESIGAKKYYTDYHELLADREIEAVCIAYPFTMNHEIACAAMQADKHLMVEKPIATCLEDAQDMLQKSRNVETVTLLAENFRYRKMLEKVREMIGEGVIGKPYTFIWNIIGYTPRSNKYISDSKWRLHSHYGLLFDGSVHFISAFRELFGNIKSAIGFTASSKKDVGTNDTVTYQMVFENGMTGTYHMFQSSYGYDNHDAVIFGSEGTIKIAGLKDVTITTPEKEEHISFDNDDGYMAELSDFYDCIVNGKKPKGSFEEGYKDFLADVVAFAPMERWDKLKLSDFSNDDQSSDR